MRLDKYLADSNVATRREVKNIIKNKRVLVNGIVCTEPERKINDTDIVEVDGNTVKLQGRTVVMLYKPAGYVTSTDDPRDPTVMEVLPAEYRKLVPIGRLDKDTEGLLLFTNDGELEHKLIAPKREINKRYYVEYSGVFHANATEIFQEGCCLRDGTKCRPARLTIIDDHKCFVDIHEGKYHQVKRMIASVGCHVDFLKRVSFGGLSLDEMTCGEYRELSENEILNLEKLTR